MSDFSAESARLNHANATAVSGTHSGSAWNTAGSAFPSDDEIQEKVAAAVARIERGRSLWEIPPTRYVTATTDSQPELTNCPGNNRHDTSRSIRIVGSGKRASASLLHPPGGRVRFVSPTRLIQPLGGDDPSVLGPLRDRRVYRLYGAFEIHPDEEQDERDFQKQTAEWWEEWRLRTAKHLSLIHI